MGNIQEGRGPLGSEHRGSRSGVNQVDAQRSESGWRGTTIDSGYRALEQHANRVLMAGALVAANLLALEAVRAFTTPRLVHHVIAVLLTLSLILLLRRMGVRTLRHAITGARDQARASLAMSAAVRRFAEAESTTQDSIQALHGIAADSGVEAFVITEDRMHITGADGRRHAIDEGVARGLGRFLSAGTVQLVGNIEAAPWVPDVIVASAPTSNALAIAPLWHGPELLGCMVRRFPDARSMRRSDVLQSLGAIAAISAVALGKAVASDREQARLRDNELLLATLGTEADAGRRDYLGEFAERAAEIVHGRRAAVFALAGGQYRLVGAAGTADHGTPLASTGASLATRSPLVRLVTSMAPTTTTLSLDHFDCDGAVTLGTLGFGLRVAAAPARDCDGVCALVVVDLGQGALDPHERGMLEALARQVGVALTRHSMGRIAARRSRHLARTPRLARQLTGLRHPEDAARATARELAHGFGFGRVSVSLGTDPDSIRIVASSGLAARAEVPLTSSHAMREAIASGRPFVACGGDENGVGHRTDGNAPAGCRSQITVPVVGVDGSPVGTISVYERDPDALAEDDLHTLETVADHLAGTIEQAQLFERLERNYFRTVEALAAALEAKDAYTLDHARSITELSAAVGARLGMRDEDVRDLKLGALLHDIGKIGIPSEILNKPGPLTDDEFEVMKQHTLIGEQIIAPIEFLEGVRPMVLHEHENWDGTGYPHGLAGEAIPIGARIIFVCDAFHAMTSNRPYRNALPFEEAMRRLQRGAGRQFDPSVVEAFIEVVADRPDLAEMASAPQLV